MKKDLETQNLQINGLETKMEEVENFHKVQRKEQERKKFKNWKKSLNAETSAQCATSLNIIK